MARHQLFQGQEGAYLERGDRLRAGFNSLDIVTTAAVSDERSVLITGASNRNYARIWDLESPRFSETPKYWDLKGHDRQITTVAVTREGNRLVTGSSDRTVRIWDADTHESTQVFERLMPRHRRDDHSGREVHRLQLQRWELIHLGCRKRHQVKTDLEGTERPLMPWPSHPTVAA